MEKPIKRTVAELLQYDCFVDFLYEVYEPTKNSAGENFSNGLDYVTNETSYMSSDTEKEFIEEYGLAPIGLLELLRIQMAKSDEGFGICVSNKNLKKALTGMTIDYELDLQDLEKYYEQLLEFQLIVIIKDSKGNQYATTTQTIFNWEYKMWSRWYSREYKRRKSAERKNEADKEKKPKETAPKAPATAADSDTKPSETPKQEDKTVTSVEELAREMLQGTPFF